jgi:valyl-tRNA synthetase
MILKIPTLKYYYPTNDISTAPEILFFWVARMIFAGYESGGKNHSGMFISQGWSRSAKGAKCKIAR